MLYKTKIAQVADEIDRFIAVLQSEDVKSYLEIGSQYGGSLWKVATSLERGAKIISIDLPFPGHDTATSLMGCTEELRKGGYDAMALFGDSTKPENVAMAKENGPYDAIFIDGNHTLDYVTADWNNYADMARIVAFHDIAWDKPVRPG